MRLLATLIGLFVLGQLLAGPQARPAGRLEAAGFAPAAFLALGPALPAATAPQRGVLPTSVFPDHHPRCSVEDPAPPNRCSVLVGAGSLRCTARCDAGEACSVLAGMAASLDSLFCSAVGIDGARCSVLPPSPLPPGAASSCSAGVGHTFVVRGCSVLRGARQQSCSALNPANADGNRCSALQGVFESLVLCSVIGGGSAHRAFCSVAGDGPKSCSSYADFTNCSIRPNQRGACTAFRGAPAGSCSAQAGFQCSVFGGGGPGPGGVCRVP